MNKRVAKKLAVVVKRMMKVDPKHRAFRMIYNDLKKHYLSLSRKDRETFLK